MLEVDVGSQLGDFSLSCGLTVAPGRAVAVVGGSGAGKTTLLRMVAGLARPERGRIACAKDRWFDARLGLFVPPQERSCGMVFAEYALFGHLTAFENVAFGLRASGARGAAVRDRASRVIDLIGVGHLAGRRASSLSSGEMQRVAIARALALSPRVLLLDEPLSAIDVERRSPVRDALRHSIADAGIAAVVVTHDPIEAMLFADHLVVLERGSVVQEGSAADLRARPRSSYVAAFAGVNLLRGIAHPRPGGISVVDVDHTSITILGEWTGPVALAVDPDSVVLSRTRPLNSSARNSLNGPVAYVVPDGSAVRVSIASSPPIIARITAQSASDLDIEPNAQLVATFKASEVRVH